MKSCIYAGSFDPFHNGHRNLVLRALKTFDIVHILIATNSKKKYLFTNDEKESIIYNSLKGHSIVVSVLPENKLVVDYAKEKGVDVILKGIRNLQDTEYEKMLHEITVSQENGIDTFVLFSSPEDQKISSSAVKELIRYNADVRGYVTSFTKQMMEIKQNDQCIIGVTGTIGSGKSHITKLLEQCATDFIEDDHSKNFTHIDLDVISNELTYSNNSYYTSNNEVMSLRKSVKIMLDLPDNVDIGTLKNRLTDEIFKSDRFNYQIKNMYKPVMVREIRKRIVGRRGLIVINGALLVEEDMTYLCNNNIIHVVATNETLEKRLKNRYKNDTDVKSRIRSQLDCAVRQAVLSNKILDDNNGTIVIIDTDEEPFCNSELYSEHVSWLRTILENSCFFDRMYFVEKS